MALGWRFEVGGGAFGRWREAPSAALGLRLEVGGQGLRREGWRREAGPSADGGRRLRSRGVEVGGRGGERCWRLEAKTKKNLGTEAAIGRYVFPFEKLDVYKLTVDLAEYVLTLLEKLPANKHLRLVSQMEAAVTSPAQNIAEGKGRQYKKEFIQFLHIAQGSLYEVVTLNEIFLRKQFFQLDASIEVRRRCEQVDRKLNGLINSLRGTRGRAASNL